MLLIVHDGTELSDGSSLMLAKTCASRRRAVASNLRIQSQEPGSVMG